MYGVGQPRSVTPIELLDIRQHHWGQRLRVVSLAAESIDDVPAHQREQALGVLGDLYKQGKDARRREGLLRRWPAVHVLATAGIATERYDGGGFWPRLGESLDIQADQIFHREWGEAFLDNLRALDLPSFDGASFDAGTRYVGRILMHAGVPTHCLRDYFRIIDEHRRRVPGLSPPDFVSWATTRAETNRLYNVDKPVARFLQYGDEFAVDVCGRTFELLDTVVLGGDGVDVPLPDRFRQVARQMRSTRELSFAQAGITAGPGAQVGPTLIIDPFGHGLILRLPAVGDAPDGTAIWVVDFDGVTQRVTTRALFPGDQEPAPATEVPIPEPIRTASVALDRREHLRSVLSVVDDTDPLLAFGDDGTLLPPGLPLPATDVWLLFPGEPEDLRIDSGDATTRSESPVPPGWAGWSLVMVDLGDATSLSVGEGRQRAVRRHAAARIVTGEPVRGMRTAAGLSVFAKVPEVRLPEQLCEARWDVAILNERQDIVARWTSVDHDQTLDAVWSRMPRPILGTFTVRVRGPWGRGATRTITIVEGIGLSLQPAWRRFEGRGLQPCTARVTPPEGMASSRNHLELGERDRDAQLRVGAHGVFRNLVVTPPHMSVAYQSAGQSAGSSVRPLSLFREEVIENPGTLVLDIGADASPHLHLFAASQLVQVIEPAAGRAGVYRFDLSKLVDTLGTIAQSQLALDPAGQLIVGSLRSRRLFREVMLAGGDLEFSECVEVLGLTAFVYSTRAPWRDAAQVPITGGRAALPEWLRGAGPVRVHVQVQDPWLPTPVPVWPDVGMSRLVEADGFVTDDDPEATAVSAFLAGEGGLPTEIADFTRLWTARGLLGALDLQDQIGSVADAIDALVQAQPGAALLALSESRTPTELIPRLLIRGGLPWANIAAAHTDTAPQWTPRSALTSALLCAADSEWSSEEADAAVIVCGGVVTDLLRGDDPFARVGRIDQSAELYDRSSPTTREAIVRLAALVPSGLLSADSRVLAVMEFIDRRREPQLEWLTNNVHKAVIELERLLRMIDEPVTSMAYRARRHPTAERGWRMVPAVSLGLALAARHAARGHAIAAEWLPKQARVWADLAQTAPQLVSIDLLLAELLVASTHRSRSESSQ